jgi:Ran GTPase-activating protein (RanGAP) involved in mRNA processing and transport
MALLQNQHLTTLKLGYNNLGDYGASMLAEGINSNVLNLSSLDLGFNNIGDVGCTALCRAISPRLHTLYLAGNLIGEDGAVAISDLIRKRGSRLRKLYLTGNLIGPDGVKAITEAIIETETIRLEDVTSTAYNNNQNYTERNTTQSRMATADMCKNGSIEELYLGGSGMGAMGCQYIARLLEISQKLRVISLPNCEIDDESLVQIASSIKANRERLPLQSLQLSFNRITCKGVECLSNSVWGSRDMQELLLDNNEIADRGAQCIAAVLLPHVKTLEVLNIGFNLIKAPGIQILMKAVVDTNCTLRSLSISGNSIDTNAAKAISYALAYNRTLHSLSLVHCNIGHEGQRHISAGIVSNSRSALREVSGYDLGPVIVTLGFPAAIESWSNDKILYFLQKMWTHHRIGHASSVDRSFNEVDTFSPEEEEKLTDPLNFLDDSLTVRTAPEDATIVVEVANKAYAELCERDHELEGFTRKRRGCDRKNRDPLSHENATAVASLQPPIHSNCGASMLPANKMASFVASPEPRKQILPDPVRKTRIAEWLSANIKELTKLSHLPFSSSELWRLHQHYFSPVVNESGGETITPSSNSSANTADLTASSVPAVSRPSSTENPFTTILENSDGDVSSMSQLTSTAGSNHMSSLPILKRKVSYRFLGEAASFTAQCGGGDNRNVNEVASTPQTVSLMIDVGPVGHTMPPTTKRARRNRSRISFLPRIKAKVDSYLDVSHDKALVTMRQLYYVELAILSGQVNPIQPTENGTPYKHLCGELANDAEIIIVDMM